MTAVIRAITTNADLHFLWPNTKARDWVWPRSQRRPPRYSITTNIRRSDQRRAEPWDEAPLENTTANCFLVLMAASLTVTMHVQPQHEVEAYKKMLRDKGEKLEISEVLPPHVPDASNGVALLESAFGLLVPTGYQYTNLPPAMQMVAPGKAMVGWIQPNGVKKACTVDQYGWKTRKLKLWLTARD